MFDFNVRLVVGDAGLLVLREDPSVCTPRAMFSITMVLRHPGTIQPQCYNLLSPTLQAASGVLLLPADPGQLVLKHRILSQYAVYDQQVIQIQHVKVSHATLSSLSWEALCRSVHNFYVHLLQVPLSFSPLLSFSRT